MPRFHVPMILEVEANSYEEAVEKAGAFHDSINFDWSPAIVNAYIETDFDRDNENQRVIYLHDESNPL